MTGYKYSVPKLPDDLVAPQTEREQRYLEHVNKLSDMIRKDFATGLLHREEYEAQTEGQEGTTIFIDGDNLKKINDLAESHEAGDAAIKAIALAISSMEGAIRSALRAGDKERVSRMGGDEFAIFLPKASLETGIMVANRILESIRRQVITFPKLGQHRLTASIGVGKTKADADKALYLAKQRGRNRVEVVSDTTASTRLIDRLTKSGHEDLALYLVKRHAPRTKKDQK